MLLPLHKQAGVHTPCYTTEGDCNEGGINLCLGKAIEKLLPVLQHQWVTMGHLCCPIKQISYARTQPSTTDPFIFNPKGAEPGEQPSHLYIAVPQLATLSLKEVSKQTAVVYTEQHLFHA